MKKKGLIISTVVMVVVLIASLTTATYAWFTSDAKATVENLNIQAEAVSGVQIAVNVGDTTVPYTTGYTNGTLQYEGGKWSSTEELDGWGMLLDFGAINLGQINNAVTRYDASKASDDAYKKALGNAHVFTKADGLDDSTFSGAKTTYWLYDSSTGIYTKCTEDDTFKEDSADKYYTAAALEDGKYYRPLGYDDELHPTSYEEVQPNVKNADANPYTTYYRLPLSVKAVKDTRAIVCTIEINSTATGTFAPGMAAATRIRVSKDGTEGAYTFEPYKDVKLTSTGMQGSTDAAEDVNQFSFIIAYAESADNLLTADDHYDFVVEIWVEGTDNECSNITTLATNFGINFAFDVSDEELSGNNLATATKYKKYDFMHQKEAA